MNHAMRAVVLDAPGPPSALAIRELPVPNPPTGWVLIKVKAFGLNRSELHTRLGLAQGVTFPRVLGIEAAGVVAQCPGGEFPVGQQVVAMMGGMGRVFDGGYAEYTCVPAAQVIAFRSDLDWATLGALPEMLQTSYGSLTIGLDAQPGQSILIRGGASSVGMATAVLAIPTEEAPPLIRMDCPGWASRPIVREPYDVWSISGSAPRVAQSRSLRNAMTWAAGTHVYSA